MLNFIETSGALAAGQLTSTNVGLSFHNVQRKRLEKYGKQYIATDHQPVKNLLSEGQADTSSGAVKKSRRGFQDTRRLLVISQWYRYSLDTAARNKIRRVLLDWASLNIPDGNPINETHFEGFLKAIRLHRDLFNASENAILNAWLTKVRNAAEGFTFPGRATRYGNWYTHHLKKLLLCYYAQEDTAAFNALLPTIDAHALVNFPYGNAAVIVPPVGVPFNQSVHDIPRAATHTGESIDYIRRDSLHYHVYDVEPWLEIAILTGSRYEALMDNAWAFLKDKLFSSTKHYEFAASTDPFDAERWLASRPEYLAPNAMFIPGHASRVALAYSHFKRLLNPAYQPESRMVTIASRSERLTTDWYYWFRLFLGYA
jgi:hypothetical protein